MGHLESHSHLPVRIILSLELGEGLEYRGGDCSCGAVLLKQSARALSSVNSTKLGEIGGRGRFPALSPMRLRCGLSLIASLDGPLSTN